MVVAMSSKLQKARSATAPILGDDDTPRSVRSNLSKTTDPRLAGTAYQPLVRRQLQAFPVQYELLLRNPKAATR